MEAIKQIVKQQGVPGQKDALDKKEKEIDLSKIKTIMDICGQDMINGPNKRPKVYDISGASNIISAQSSGVIGQGVNINIQQFNQGTVIYCNRTHVLCQAYFPAASYQNVNIAGPQTPPKCFVENALHLMQAQSLKIGNETWSFVQDRFYAKAKLLATGKMGLLDYSNGLVMQLDGDKLACVNETNPYSDSNYTGLYVGANLQAIVFQQNSTNNIYYEYQKGLERFFVSRAYPIYYAQATPNTISINPQQYMIKVALPLTLLCPSLASLPDQCLVLLKGQQLYLNLQTCQYSDILINNNQPTIGLNNTAVANPGFNGCQYSLYNMQLLQCYSMLEDKEIETLFASTIILPKVQYYQFSQTIPGSTINNVYPIDAGSKIRGLWFMFCPLFNPNNCIDCLPVGLTSADGINWQGFENVVTAHFSAGVAPSQGGALTYQTSNPANCRLTYPMSCMPICIQQITINCGGSPQVFDMQALQWFDITQSFVDVKATKNEPYERAFNTIYYLDMTQWQQSLGGSESLSKGTTQINVKIQLLTGSGNIPSNVQQVPLTIFGQNAQWSTNPAFTPKIDLINQSGGSASIYNYQFMSFLEYQDLIHLKKGMYMRGD